MGVQEHGSLLFQVPEQAGNIQSAAGNAEKRPSRNPGSLSPVRYQGFQNRQIIAALLYERDALAYDAAL